jgi:hypothetical protein
MIEPWGRSLLADRAILIQSKSHANNPLASTAGMKHEVALGAASVTPVIRIVIARRGLQTVDSR